MSIIRAREVGDIWVGVDVKDMIIEEGITGKIFAKRDVSKVSVIGDINLIQAMRDVKTISSQGNVEVVAHRDAVGIEGMDGIVYYGRKYSKISENLSIEKLV